nr:tRNA pseudouridine(55) synthase TruB [Sinimarinibacterium sp. CAU 1509]
MSGILLLDKPLGLSSNQALQRVKFLYQADKAGHTGSLDPLATGMLPICLGEATKLSGVLLDSDKIYRARVRLGQRTDTGDAEGQVIASAEVSAGLAEIEAVLPRFLGEILQVPPMYSALKQGGERLYALARQGIEVERQARPVTIHGLRIESFDTPEFDLWVHCSKGTYIRTLAEDIATAVGQCAFLAGLRRLSVAPFSSQAPVSLETLQQTLDSGGLEAIDRLLLTPAEGVAHWSQLRVDAEQERKLAHGRAVELSDLPPNQARFAVLNQQGQLLGLAESDGLGRLLPRRWLTAG